MLSAAAYAAQDVQKLTILLLWHVIFVVATQDLTSIACNMSWAQE